MAGSSEVGDTVIFVHGAGSNADFWHLQRAAFPRAHFVDLPAHGDQPSAVDHPSSIADYADWLSEYVESTGLQRVALDGHSLGGAVALELALRHPGWLRGLVLTCSGARYPVPPRVMELLNQDFEAAVDYILAQSFGPSVGPLTYRQKAIRHGTKRQMLRNSPDVVLGDYEACMAFDVRKRLVEIEVPTLVIAGGQDRITPPRLSRELHNGIKGSRLVVIEDAGHMLPMERPDEYNAILLSFVTQPGF
jgi:pimeloyl-ACP methyl ester carboxylesterase